MNISAHKFCCKMNYRFIDLLPDVRMMDILSKKGHGLRKLDSEVLTIIFIKRTKKGPWYLKRCDD
jgi:hypothetical protein